MHAKNINKNIKVNALNSSIFFIFRFSLFTSLYITTIKNHPIEKMTKEHSYLIMIVPTEELTLQELADYDEMPWVEVDFGIGPGEAAIIKQCY